ncbi:MAG: hypothetical protein H6918_01970 [Sphingomonadaceae bacterium]|nr:hypothetical protein [Sphingomonadaceae bacterium]
MYGLSGHLKLAALGLAAITLIGGSILLDEEDGMLAQMAAGEDSADTAPAAAVAQERQPEARPAQPQSPDDVEGGFTDDDDLVDDASGFDSDGFDTDPMVDTDPAKLGDMGETAIISDSGPATDPSLAASGNDVIVSDDDGEADY